jgi:hypothetical protein
MKRFTAISLLLVLTGWLLLPAAGADLASCSMQCCRRKAASSKTHCHGEEMNSGDHANRPVMSGNPPICPSRCISKNRGGSPFVLGPGTQTSTPIDSRAGAGVPRPSQGAEPKLLGLGERAPPLSA